MTPFGLIDLIGRKVTLSMLESLYASAPERFFVGEALEAVTSSPSTTSVGDDIAATVSASTSISAIEIHNRVIDALVREVSLMLETKVVTNIRDIDLCMINGAGWPAAIGGLTPYLDECGASERVLGRLLHPTANRG